MSKELKTLDNSYHVRQLRSKLHVALDELRYKKKELRELEEYIEDIEYSIKDMTNGK